MGELIVWLIVGALIYAAITALLPLILIIAGSIAALYTMRFIYEFIYDRKAAVRQKRQALIARADHQHRLIMAGDDIGGVYGEYLPPRGLR